MKVIEIGDDKVNDDRMLIFSLKYFFKRDLICYVSFLQVAKLGKGNVNIYLTG